MCECSSGKVRAENACAQCGGEIQRKKRRGPKSKYCSDKCRRKADNRMHRAKRTKHAAHSVLVRQSYCKHCGKQFAWFGGRKYRKYCSDQCRITAGVVRSGYIPSGKTKKEYCKDVSSKAAEARTFYCENCGKEYVKSRNRRGKAEGERFCSRECAFDYAAKRKARKAAHALLLKTVAYLKECLYCNDSFITNSRVKKVCSRGCELGLGRTKANEYAKEQSKLRDSIHCTECSVEFSRVYPSASSICGDECKAEAARRMRRTHKAKRRAREKTNGPYESIDPMTVFDRDGWQCQGCGCDTPEDLRGTHHDDAPELDHRIPLASGGLHAFDNVQTLCRVCNQLKSTKSMDVFVNEIKGIGAGHIPQD